MTRDTAVGRVFEFKAVVQNYSMFTFDVTSAYTQCLGGRTCLSGTATGGD